MRSGQDADTESLDRAYENAPHIPQSNTYPQRWLDRSADYRLRRSGRAKLGLRYGDLPRNAFDLFLPDDAPKGLMVFVHGGYWLAFGRESWYYLAEGANRLGWAVAIPSYTLAPEARINQMTKEIGRVIEAAQREVPGPVVVCGHSAGGQLSARMACEGFDLAADLRKVVPISPLADLAPIAGTTMNLRLCLDAAEVQAESPIRHRPKPGVGLHVWVGAQERAAFLWQARLLSEAWECPWTAEKGRHHFDVVDGLADPDSALLKTILGP